MSTSTSGDTKAVVRRAQAGAVVSASTSSTRKRPPKAALEEDEFTDVRMTLGPKPFTPLSL